MSHTSSAYSCGAAYDHCWLLSTIPLPVLMEHASHMRQLASTGAINLKSGTPQLVCTVWDYFSTIHLPHPFFMEIKLSTIPTFKFQNSNCQVSTTSCLLCGTSQRELSSILATFYGSQLSIDQLLSCGHVTAQYIKWKTTEIVLFLSTPQPFTAFNCFFIHLELGGWLLLKQKLLVCCEFHSINMCLTTDTCLN